MLISHEYFDGPFNPEAVDAIAHETDTHSHRYIVLLLSSGAKINSKPLGDKDPSDARDQLERDINRACVDINGEGMERDYDGSEPLPNLLNLEISNEDGTLLELIINPRESLVWNSGHMIINKPFSLVVKPALDS